MEDISPFSGATDTMLWTSGDIWDLDFKTELDFAPACNSLLRFTSGATPADLLVTSMAAQPFHPHTYVQALVWFGPGIKRAATSQCETRQTPYRLRYAGSAKRFLFISLESRRI